MKINQLYPGMFIHFGNCSASERMEMADLLEKVKLKPKIKAAFEKTLMGNDMFFLQWHVPGCYDAGQYSMVSDSVGAKELGFEEFKMRFLGLYATTPEEDAMYEAREAARANSGLYPGLCTPVEDAQDLIDLLEHLYDRYGYTAPIPKHKIAETIEGKQHCLTMDDETNLNMGIIPEFHHRSREDFLKIVAGESPITGKDLLICAAAMKNSYHSNRSQRGDDPLEELLRGMGRR